MGKRMNKAETSALVWLAIIGFPIYIAFKIVETIGLGTLLAGIAIIAVGVYWFKSFKRKAQQVQAVNAEQGLPIDHDRINPTPTVPPLSSTLSQTTQQIPQSEPYSQQQRSYDIHVFGAGAKAKSSVTPDMVWVSQGRTIEIHGYSISGGFIYFGSGLQAVNGWQEEPALINPSLPVDKRYPDRAGSNMGYWPSYSQIPPICRAAFLEWLSTGRKDPQTNIGYIFIYFYGLERRVISDVKDSSLARNEISAIVAEVKRLLSIYGANHSFRGYATRLLDAIIASNPPQQLYRNAPDFENSQYGIPTVLKVALGQMAVDDVPLPAEWAFAWAINDPGISKRTPAQRCPEEFRRLFLLRYNEKFGEGLKLKPNKARIQLTYYPASASLKGQSEALQVPDLPDVTLVTGPSSKISELVTVCTDELEGYSRYLGRNPEGKDSIEAAAYLPQPLLKGYSGKDFQKLSFWLSTTISSGEAKVVQYASILQQVPSIKGDAVGKKEATAISNLLAKMNVGIEPDPRFGTFVPKADQDVVLFKISDMAPSSPSTEYSAASVVLHLAAAVANANETLDQEEERHLKEHLETWLHLDPDEKSRLRAHTLWLFTSFPGMNGIKKRIEMLKQDQKESLGRFLVGVAQADGYIDPMEMKALTKIYTILNLDPQSLYSHAHAVALEPFTVQAADFVTPHGHAIPAPPKSRAEVVALDMGTIEAKLAETVAVSAILNNIFTDEEPVSVQPGSPEPVASTASVVGLDAESLGFMQVLASKLTWAREELEKLASEHSIMLDGTLDAINDASFDHFGGPFFEGDDPIEINPDFAKEIAV